MQLDGLNTAALDRAVQAVLSELRFLPKISCCWQDCDEAELWIELASCILGSAVSYEQASSSVNLLKLGGLLQPPIEKLDFTSLEGEIFAVLAGSVENHTHNGQSYRFPRSRARQLRLTAEAIYGRGGSLRKVLNSASSSHLVRAELVRLAYGLGPKQASLFLRNICYEDFAVLDRHVIRFMFMKGLLESTVAPRNLPQYEEMEAAFLKYARAISAAVTELDVAVWIVMRAVGHESQQWLS